MSNIFIYSHTPNDLMNFSENIPNLCSTKFTTRYDFVKGGMQYTVEMYNEANNMIYLQLMLYTDTYITQIFKTKIIANIANEDRATEDISGQIFKNLDNNYEYLRFIHKILKVCELKSKGKLKNDETKIKKMRFLFNIFYRTRTHQMTKLSKDECINIMWYAFQKNEYNKFVSAMNLLSFKFNIRVYPAQCNAQGNAQCNTQSSVNSIFDTEDECQYEIIRIKSEDVILQPCNDAYAPAKYYLYINLYTKRCGGVRVIHHIRFGMRAEHISIRYGNEVIDIGDENIYKETLDQNETKIRMLRAVLNKVKLMLSYEHKQMIANFISHN